MTSKEQMFIRWTHLGSCVLRTLFNKKTLPSIKIDEVERPVEISTFYRRDMHSMFSDIVHELPIELSAEDQQFLDFWRPSNEVLLKSDFIIADLIMDAMRIHYPRFIKSSTENAICYNKLIMNFPLEPSQQLAAQIALLEVTEEEIIKAWDNFGANYQTPTTFLMVETLDEIPQGYSEPLRSRLLNLQKRIQQLAQKYSHWHIIWVDDFLKQDIPKYYRDRHHLTDEGLDFLRKTVIAELHKKKVFKAFTVGPKVNHKSWLVPERCDFVRPWEEYYEALSKIYDKPLIIGPDRVTQPVLDFLTEKGCSPIIATHYGEIAKKDCDAVILMKWNQVTKIQPWLNKVLELYPEQFIELVSQWTEFHQMVPSVEMDMRKQLIDILKGTQQTVILDTPPALCKFILRTAVKLYGVKIASQFLILSRHSSSKYPKNMKSRMISLRQYKQLDLNKYCVLQTRKNPLAQDAPNLVGQGFFELWQKNKIHKIFNNTVGCEK